MDDPASNVIEFSCHYCGTLLRAPLNGAGKSGKCTACKRITQVPMQAEMSGCSVIQIVPAEYSQYRPAPRIAHTAGSSDEIDTVTDEPGGLPIANYISHPLQLLQFNSLLAPIIIRWVWLSGIALNTVFWALFPVWAMITGNQPPMVHLLVALPISAIGWAVIGGMWRLICELLLIPFQIYQRLG